jgi:hypothetical protein
MQPADALVTWLGLMTERELADLTAALDWLATHLDWSERPRIVPFLQALDTLAVTEQRRRSDPTLEMTGVADAVGLALATLDRLDLQSLLRSWLRLARNREKDASEPVSRFHTAVSDLLTRELASRL